MKTKRFLSLLLALVMALSLAAPAFAAGDDPNEGIMPLQQIFDDEEITISGGHYQTRPFAATSGNGKTIHFWCRNYADHPVEVYVFRTDKTASILSYEIPANGGTWESDYNNSTADSASYYIVLQVRGNYPIHCRLAAAQYC